MKDFITALTKHSSITCVTRERFGRTEIEFFSYKDAELFVNQMHRLWSPPGLWTGWIDDPKKKAHLINNFDALHKIWGPLTLPAPQVHELKASSGEENQHTEWRFRLSWEFESGVKAADLFQRLLWILE